MVAEIVKKAPRLSFFRFASTRAGPDGCMTLVNAIAEGKGGVLYILKVTVVEHIHPWL